MLTNLDEMASNVSDGVVKLTEKDVPGQSLCIALSRITIYILQTVTTMVGVSRNKKIRNEIAFYDYLA